MGDAEADGQSDLESEPEDEQEGNDEWNGIPEPEPVDHTAEYVDEDKYTTVDVEEIDLSKAKDGLDSDDDEDERARQEQKKQQDEETKTKPKLSAEKIAASQEKAKRRRKKRNFRYESKEDRKVTRFKERTSNRKRAKERRQGDSEK